MSPRTRSLEERVRDYLLTTGLREPAILRKLRAATAPLPRASMQISPEVGQLLGILVRILGARRCLEIGTFTGYSALAVALALPENGRLIACDVSEEWTAIARRFWREAGVAGRVELRLGPAIETLDKLIASGESGRFDFAFIDANKSDYDGYYERALELLRPGGVVAIDNVLWGGSVADPAARDRDTMAIKALNRKIHADRRVAMAMMPLGDGLTLACKL